ncbi:hypothetical protein [Acrocarpospora sp. B8E8]|uniref:hypothetical protein n=1 Tax=Acrocarpospora sp. B8E8 TaxID=3153572 RepID=UPI00325CAE9D
MASVLRAELVADAYGHRRDWVNAAVVVSVPCVVLPAASREAELDRETTVTTFHVYCKAADVLATDRLLLDGLACEVIGEPVRWAGRTATFMKITARTVTA